MFRHLSAATLLAASVFASLPAFAQTTALQAANALAQEGTRAYQAKDYARAGQLYTQAFDTDGSYPTVLYNAACSFALAGDAERAFAALRRAMAAGYVNAASTEKDSDFASLHGDPRWQAVLDDMRKHETLEARLWDSPALQVPYRENLSEDEKVAGLSRFWAEVKFNFVFVEKLKEIDWDRLYLEALPKVRASTSTGEYYRILMALCARLQEGHTNVYPPLEIRDRDMARPKVRARLVEGRVIVSEVFDEALRQKGVVPGAEITHVDGEAVRAYAARELAPYISASTPQDMEMRSYAYSFLAGPIAKAPLVRFAGADGKAFELALQRHTEAEIEKAREGTPPFVFRMLPDGVAYVALNSFGDRRAADGYIAAFPEIAKARALIIDVRRNGGGNSNEGYRVLSTLTDKPYETGKWSTRQYLPTFRAWQRPMPEKTDLALPRQPDAAHQFDKPVVVLTAPSTYSAAEDFVMAFDAMKRGRLVGEATGGSSGQPLMFKLPGGGIARIITLRDAYPDGRAWVGRGIAPDVQASPTVAGMRAGRDTQLEAAMMLLKPRTN